MNPRATGRTERMLVEAMKALALGDVAIVGIDDRHLTSLGDRLVRDHHCGVVTRNRLILKGGGRHVLVLAPARDVEWSGSVPRLLGFSCQLFIDHAVFDAGFNQNRIPLFTRTIFPLPEAQADLFLAPGSGDVWFGVYRVREVHTRDSGLNPGHTEFLFHFQQTSKKLIGVLNPARAKDLDSWLKLVGVKVTAVPDDRFKKQVLGRMQRVSASEKSTECPECYGTGFHKGFGAPCSKRCKVK